MRVWVLKQNLHVYLHYLYNTGIFSGLCIAIRQKRKQCLVYFAKKKRYQLPNIQNSSLSFCRLPSWQLVVVIVFNHHFWYMFWYMCGFSGRDIIGSSKKRKLVLEMSIIIHKYDTCKLKKIAAQSIQCSTCTTYLQLQSYDSVV